MRLSVCLGLVAVTWAPAWGGAPIGLRLGQPIALPGSAVTTVVAEFLDPENTELGRPVALVLGGELLDAVSDLPGAGVLVGTDAEGAGILRRLGGGYHRAAVAIAREQGAIAALWGTIEGTRDRVALESFVSQVPDTALGGLKVGLEWAGRAVPGFSATIPPRSFHLVSRNLARDELFARPLAILRGPRSVRSGPARSAHALASVGPDDAVQAMDLLGGWWRVTLENGTTGWLEHDENDVRIPPRQMVALGAKIPIYDRPGATEPQGEQSFRGTYRVLAARYTARGMWVRMSLKPTGELKGDEPEETAWARAASFRAEYSLPVVHFIAGLYWYRMQRYPEAAREFHAFIDAAGPAEENVTLAVAYQLAGLSRLQGPARDHDALEDLRRSVELTPFDASAYALRALGAITVAGEVPKTAIEDLNEALRLDPRDPTARDLVGAMQKLLSTPSVDARIPQLEGSLRGRETDVRTLQARRDAYPDSAYGRASK